MKVYVAAGCCCSRRFLDAERQREFFAANGHTVTGDIATADVCVFHSCGVNEASQGHSLREIRKVLAGKKPDARLYVAGCLPGMNPALLESMQIAGSFVPFEQARIDEIFPAARRWADIPDANVFVSPRAAPSLFRRSSKERGSGAWRQVFLGHLFDRFMNARGRFFIRVGNGCLGSCAYCGHRFSTGPLKSKPLETVRGELMQGLSRGYRSMHLCGEDTGCWGQDIGDSIFHLLDAVAGQEGPFTISVNDCNPRWLVGRYAELAGILKKGKIVQIQLPVQSGSERILRAMDRKYSRAEVMEMLIRLRREFPALRLLSQMIVGFPGEGEEDVRETIDFLNGVRFDYVHFFPFTAIANTPASLLPATVPGTLVAARKERFERLQARISLRRWLLKGRRVVRTPSAPK